MKLSRNGHRREQRMENKTEVTLHHTTVLVFLL